MKRTFGFILLGFLMVWSSGCKKQNTCTPEPPRAVGTWKAIEHKISGVVQDPSDPLTACLLQSEIILEENGTGIFEFHTDEPGTCVSIPVVIESWAENLEKQRLFINLSADGEEIAFALEYLDKTHLLFAIPEEDASLKFEKQ